MEGVRSTMSILQGAQNWLELNINLCQIRFLIAVQFGYWSFFLAAPALPLWFIKKSIHPSFIIRKKKQSFFVLDTFRLVWLQTNAMFLKSQYSPTSWFLRFTSYSLHDSCISLEATGCISTLKGKKYAIGMINSQTIPSQEKNLPKFEESIMENI